MEKKVWIEITVPCVISGKVSKKGVAEVPLSVATKLIGINRAVMLDGPPATVSEKPKGARVK